MSEESTIRTDVVVSVSESRMLYQYEPYKIELTTTLHNNNGVSGAEVKAESDRLSSLINVIISERVHKLEEDKN